MQYKIEEVYADSEHELAEEVEDDFQVFVTNEDGDFWPAEEFFNSTGLMEFYTDE
jgi:hypothetical protein